MKFRSINRRRMPGIIAKVNRETGDLYINPDAWNRLSPSHRDFVLLHEEGHFVLQDPSEEGANDYAVRNYIKSATTTDDFGHRITVMSDMLMNESAQFDLARIGDIVSNIFTGLADLGIGSKSRIKEIESTEELIQQQGEVAKGISDNKAMNQLLIIGALGLIVIVGIVIFLKLKK